MHRPQPAGEHRVQVVAARVCGGGGEGEEGVAFIIYDRGLVHSNPKLKGGEGDFMCQPNLNQTKPKLVEGGGIARLRQWEQGESIGGRKEEGRREERVDGGSAKVRTQGT